MQDKLKSMPEFTIQNLAEIEKKKTTDLNAALNRIENNCTYHPPKDNQPERYVNIRGHAKILAIVIAKLTPASREQSLALTKLEECVMWADAAIARNE